MNRTIANVINELDACTMDGAKQTQDPVSMSKNLAFSNCTAGSALAKNADVGSRVYTVSNVSERLANECMNEKGKFTVCQMKHCTAKEQHYKLLMCFGAGQCSKVEVFAVDSRDGLLDSSSTDFPDLTKGYTFETPHSAILSAPTIFTSSTALRNSALNLVELFRLDNLRTQNKHPAGGHEEILANIMEQYKSDGGVMRKPNAGDGTWAIEFERPGSDVMQRTGIDTRFYRVDDIDCLGECLDFSDAHVNVLPLKFVHEDDGQWIAMMCFGDKDGCLAEVNVIDLETGSLLMIDDDKDFPRLDEGVFVPIFPPGKVLRSKNKFVEPISLGEKIQATANYLVDAMRVVERMNRSASS